MGNRKQHGWIQVLADGKTPASGAESRLCGFCLPLSSLPSAQVSAVTIFQMVPKVMALHPPNTIATCHPASCMAQITHTMLTLALTLGSHPYTPTGTSRCACAQWVSGSH